MSEQKLMMVKLLSGEELISKVDEDTETGNLLLTQPYEIQVHVDAKGNVKGGFKPFMPLANSAQIVLVQRPVAIATPDDSLVDSYLRLIGDKVIETPPTKLVVPK